MTATSSPSPSLAGEAQRARPRCDAELTAALREVGESDATGVILAATGPVFSAGHNFGDMEGASLDQARELLDVCTTMMDTIQQIPQPVVAQVHALATAAGCQLVATCDLAIAAESAAFAIPGGKGGRVLPHATGRGRSQRRAQAVPGDGVHGRPDRRCDSRRLAPHHPRRCPDHRLDEAVARPHHTGHAWKCPVEGDGQAQLLRPGRSPDHPKAYSLCIRGDVRQRV